MTTDLQLFPALDHATEAALRSSIRRHGVLVPAIVDQAGRTIDGHHRRRIAAEENVTCPTISVDVDDEDHAREIAATVNADRRHLSPQQRREIVAELREQGHSLRAIAGAVGASKDTVQRDLETVSPETVPDRIIGRDGKSRPASRPAPAPVPTASDDDLDDLLDDLEDEPLPPSPPPPPPRPTPPPAPPLTAEEQRQLDIEAAHRRAARYLEQLTDVWPYMRAWCEERDDIAPHLVPPTVEALDRIQEQLK